MGITGEQQGEQDIASNMEDPTANSSRKIRKPYTITKSRESWSDIEHDKFIEALQLYVLSYSTSSYCSFACFCAFFWLIWCCRGVGVKNFPLFSDILVLFSWN
jgi:hypothetical protein